MGRLLSIDLETYSPRPVSALGVEDFEDWRLKVYGIAYERDLPDNVLLEAARAAADEHLPSPAVTDRRYGVGFLGAHQGKEGNFVFVDWWADQTDLHHCVFYSSLENPGQLRPAKFGEPIACVWDIAVIAHERQAWLKHVLKRDDGPDLDAYLNEMLERRI